MGTESELICYTMKKLLITLLIGFVSLQSYSQIPLGSVGYTPLSPNTKGFDSYSTPSFTTYPSIPLGEVSYERLDVIVKSGWYEATVKYYNPSTRTKSTYTLNVKVFNDRVTTISFGNEGSLHSGHNNSGYTYSGGNLTFHEDKSGDIVAITTRVSISHNGTTTYYDVEL